LIFGLFFDKIKAMILIVETERLILRPLTLDDAETAFCGWTGDTEAMKYVSWLPHNTIGETVEWLKEVALKVNEDGNITKNDNYIWGFELKETGKLIGSGGLIWENDWGLFQVGYNINKDYWALGYTTEAMSAIIQFASAHLGIKRLMGGYAKDNTGSQRVLEKLGFVYHHDSMTPHVDGVRVFDSKEYMLDIK
jgi:ribosomal-protein-alanine N-acetyltransferase